jgi:hypothetical protein
VVAMQRTICCPLPQKYCVYLIEIMVYIGKTSGPISGAIEASDDFPFE